MELLSSQDLEAAVMQEFAAPAEAPAPAETVEAVEGREAMEEKKETGAAEEPAVDEPTTDGPTGESFVGKLRRSSSAMLAGFFNPRSSDGDDASAAEHGSPSSALIERARQIVRRGSTSAASMMDLVSVTSRPYQRPTSQVGSKEYRTEAWAASVSRCVLLRALAPAEVEFVRQATKVIKVSSGEVVYRHGDAPNMLYLVHSGTFQAKVEADAGNSWVAREYGAFDSFGGCEMLIQERRTLGRCCTITALSNGVLWGIPQRIVELKLRLTPPPRPGMDVNALYHFSRQLPMLSCLTQASLEQLNRCAARVILEPGEVLCEKGDPARAIYAVYSGTVLTIGRQAGSDFELTMEPPMTFGESALVFEDEARVRQAKICADENGATLIKWQVNEIETLIGYQLHAASERSFTCKFFEPIRCGSRSIVEGLDMNQISRLVSVMSIRCYDKNEVVACEGKMDEELFVIKSGQVIAKRPTESVAGGPLATLVRGECFGEQALMQYNPSGINKGAKRRFNIVVSGNGPMVAFVLSPAMLLEQNDHELSEWLGQLAADLVADKDTMFGVDAVVRQKAMEEGLDVSAVLAKAKKSRRSR